jgi:hypothetical protein
MTEREEGLASVGQLGRFGKSQKAHTVTGGDFSVCGGVVHADIISVEGKPILRIRQ